MTSLTPALKIKTIEQINTAREEDEAPKPEGTKTDCGRSETILESLIKRPATQPRVPHDWRPGCAAHRMRQQPQDWKPADRCYFCEEPTPPDGVGGAAREGGANSPTGSESDDSSVSEARSPAAAAQPPAAPPPALLAHLLQLNQNPQAIAQFQQMMATLAALGSGLMPLSQLMQRATQQQHVDRLTAEMGEKVSVSSSSPAFGGGSEQPLDLSARAGSVGDPATPPPLDKIASRPPPIDHKQRLKRACESGAASAAGAVRRGYTDDELQNALRDIQSGRLGTRRAALLYGIPRSTLRNKVYQKSGEGCEGGEGGELAALYRCLVPQEPPAPPLTPAHDDDSGGVILKIPTFPPPERDDPTPPAPRLPDLPFPPLAFPPAAPPDALFSIHDVIAKSISRKFQQPSERDDPRPDRRVSVIKHPPEPRAPPYPPPNSRPPNNGAPAPGGKGTRPKRGKYRNYDRDSLVEAVKAVQRGEMSVHRAGSYYGVPHSTLEYKVKERHLMRPRKREPKPPPDAKPAVKPPQPPAKLAKPPFPNGINGPDALASAPFPHGQPYPFWTGGGAGPAFPPFAPGGDFASHMMQRLRDESAPPQSNGSSFLEGIIRSSLERPGALMQRLADAPAPPALGEAGLRRLSAEPADCGSEGGSPPPARRPRLSSSDRQLAVEMREAVQRLRAAAAGRNGAPTPPHPLTAPPDRA